MRFLDNDETRIYCYRLSSNLRNVVVFVELGIQMLRYVSPGLRLTGSKSSIDAVHVMAKDREATMPQLKLVKNYVLRAS